MTAHSGPPANRPAPPEPTAGAPRRDAAEVGDRLESLLSDPIVQLLMERDGVEREVLVRMAQKVRSRAVRRDDGKSPSSDQGGASAGSAPGADAGRLKSPHSQRVSGIVTRPGSPSSGG